MIVDVTHSADADLQGLSGAIKEAQKRLGSVRPTGGRYREDQRCVRIDELQTLKVTWNDIYPIILSEFYADNPSDAPSLTSLKRMQTEWRRRTGRSHPPRK
jgi:hypothetical protein